MADLISAGSAEAIETAADVVISSEKLDESTIKIVAESRPPVSVTATYNIDQLIIRRRSIADRMAKHNASMQAELDRIDAILAEWEKVNLKP